MKPCTVHYQVMRFEACSAGKQADNFLNGDFRLWHQLAITLLLFGLY